MTPPTGLRVRIWLDAWAQPPQADLLGNMTAQVPYAAEPPAPPVASIRIHKPRKNPYAGMLIGEIPPAVVVVTATVVSKNGSRCFFVARTNGTVLP